MKKTSLSLLCFVLAISAKATVYYWDPEGATAPTASNLAGTWDGTSAQWSTTSAQTGAPVAWSPGVAACFAAGSTSISSPFTVTLNSSVTIGGIFNGSLTGLLPYLVTINGSGSLVLNGGADAFDIGSTSTTTIAVPMTGSGQVALEGSAAISFNATNTYTGGTVFGYPGVASFTGTVNFNNGKAFGTGPIQMTSSGTGGIALEGTLAATVANSFIATNAMLNIVGNAAGLTLSGVWNLPATPAIGAGNLVTISGNMSGVGGFAKYNTGTLVLSGANSYTGGTTISNGILSITADNNLGTAPSTATPNIFLSGGTLNASNTFTLNSKRLTTLTANSTLSVSSGKTMSYGGNIGGGFNLIKSGSGTLAVSGANGYNGTTTISTGTLEADSQTGSSVGTNTVFLSPGGTLSGIGVVSGLVSGNGSIAPGTATGPGTLTLGNGLTLSSGGTYVWNLASNTTAGNYSVISLIGGNMTLGGSSKLSVNFSGSASAPSLSNPFWQTQEAWTVVNVNGAGANPSSTKFTSIVNGSYAAGTFTNFIHGNGSIVLLYQPNSAVFDALYDAGQGFFSGENLILTNFSGLALSVWSSTNGNLAASNWTLVGAMSEQSLAPGVPGHSQYSINVTPTVSPTFYIAGNVNTGPYNISPVPATILSTPDFSTFNVINKTVAISTNGILALLPPQPTILANGASYSSTNGFQLQFNAVTNQSYIIQASSNLVTWSNIATGTVISSPITFVDPNGTNNSQQFYRVVLPTGY